MDGWMDGWMDRELERDREIMYLQNDLHNHHPEKMRRSMWI